jgi:RNA recognition motif-containing protein
MKLFVSNFPFTTTERELHDKFSEAGTVEGVRLITDQESGKAKGFGFVTMATEVEGHAAIETLNGVMFGGRTLRVEEAKARSSRPGQYRNDRGDRGHRDHRDRAPRESRW